MRSGTNWVFLRGRLEGVVMHETALGRPVAEVLISVPLGRGREWTVMTLPVLTWNLEFARRLQGLPLGTTIEITGHVSGRRWTRPDGMARRGSEIQLDHLAVDVADVWRLADLSAATTAPEPAHE